MKFDKKRYIFFLLSLDIIFVMLLKNANNIKQTAKLHVYAMRGQ